MLIYDQCHSVLIGLNTIQHWKRNHGLNLASPPQRLPLGIPVKRAIIGKYSKRAGDDRNKEKASLPFFPLPIAPRFLSPRVLTATETRTAKKQ